MCVYVCCACCARVRLRLWCVSVCVLWLLGRKEFLDASYMRACTRMCWLMCPSC